MTTVAFLTLTGLEPAAIQMGCGEVRLRRLVYRMSKDGYDAALSFNKVVQYLRTSFCLGMLAPSIGFPWILKNFKGIGEVVKGSWATCETRPSRKVNIFLDVFKDITD